MKQKLILFFEKFYYYPKYFIEFTFVICIFILCLCLMSFRLSSFVIGYLFAFFGYLSPASKRIENNLRLIYPLMEEKFVQSMTKRIWFNTGRFIGETPYFFFLKWRSLQKCIKIENENILLDYIKKGQSVILITSHIGNWWFVSRFFQHMKSPFFAIYRAQNNPLIRFIVKISSGAKTLAKGTGEMKNIINVLKGEGNILTIFQDHRDRNGIKIPFLGVDAMTSPFFAKLAIKYNIPVIYTSCIRDKIHATKFKMKFDILHSPKDNIINIEELTKEINNKMSKDINESKEQWFWLHKRWKM